MRKGRARGFIYDPADSYQRTEGGILLPLGWKPVTDWVHNDRTYDAASIQAKLLTSQLAAPSYALTYFYIEFSNQAPPISVPSVSPSGGLSYYNSLGSDPHKDYLRVPVSGATLTSSNMTNYPQGNVMSLFGTTSGTVGVHGKPFDSAHLSTVYGGGVIAAPNPQDATKDLVFARFYYPTNQQIPKGPNIQVSVLWQDTLT